MTNEEYRAATIHGIDVANILAADLARKHTDPDRNEPYAVEFYNATHAELEAVKAEMFARTDEHYGLTGGRRDSKKMDHSREQYARRRV
jgi:hypothetical protein